MMAIRIVLGVGRFLEFLPSFPLFLGLGIRSPSRSRTPLLYPAAKVFGLVRAAAPLINRNLRIRAPRPRPPHLIARIARRWNRIRRLALLPPLLQGRDRIEPVRAVAALTMRHPRHRKQPVRPID